MQGQCHFLTALHAKDNALEIEHQLHDILGDAVQGNLLMCHLRKSDLRRRASRQRRQEHAPQGGAQGRAEASSQGFERSLTR